MPEGTPVSLVEQLASEMRTLELLGDVLENLPIGIAVLVPVDGGRDFKYLYSNPCHQTLKPGVLAAGKTYAEVWPELAEVALPNMRRIYETGIPWTAEDSPLQVELEPGRLETRYYTFEVSRVVVEGVRLLVDRAIDTTRDTGALNALRESQERFRSVLENSLDAVYRRDIQANEYDYLSPVIEDITGFTPEEFGAMTVDDVLARIHPDDVQAVQVAIPKALESGVLELQYRLRAKDGRYVWLADNAVVVNDAEGAPRYLSGAVRNITTRKEAEDHAQTEQLRLQTLLDALPVAVFISDAQGGPVYTNEQVTEIWGEHPDAESLDEFGPYKAWRVDTGERLKPADWSGVRALKGERVIGEVLDIERFDGEHRTILNSSAPIRDQNGTITGQVTVEQDITDRRKLEEQALREKQRAEDELIRSNILKEVAAASLKLDSKALAEQVLGTLQQSIGLKAGVLYVLEEDAPVLTQLAVCGYHDDALPLFERVPLDDQSISGQSVLGNATLVMSYDALPPATRERAMAAGEVHSIWVVLPLRAVGQAIGNLTLVFGDDRVLGEDDLSLFQAVADQLGIAIANAQLYERQWESARLGDALARIDHDTHSSLQVEDVVIGALAEAAQAIGAESAAIDGIEGDEWVVWYDWGFETSIVGHHYTNEQNPHGVEAARTSEAIAIEDAFTDPRVDNETMKAYGLRSAVVAPLIVRGEPVAALYYNYHSEIHRFSRQEVEFVAKVASSLSLAIENARLYETEREVSDRLQEALLSLPDEVQGVQFAHAYHSAAEVARVGGDFYDIFDMGGGLVGITVGDVAGKGLEAAALTSLVKNTIRAHASEKGSAPARILELTNDVVFHATPTEAFSTVFFGVLDCVDGRLRYANAGHTTGALVTADGAVVALGATGPVLGAFKAMRFAEVEQRLDTGTELFLYTDGVTEARCDNEWFGDERLFALLSQFKGTDPPTMVRGVVQDVLDFAGGRLNDDMAVIAVALNGQRGPTPMPEEVQVQETDSPPTEGHR